MAQTHAESTVEQHSARLEDSHLRAQHSSFTTSECLKDVNQKQHISVIHDFVVRNHTITVTLHSVTAQWKIIGSASMFSSA
ncbi:hypothetical protein TNCV_2576261 [Trichonephila clavipes]|uniref:Uncharacterized protein n=1 Tax=Trichonephila clavipes TaxID=2585209 RepID=A0A8X6V0R8_TRICX|nr:hypothetical protein TNCV_2576261 [Trichonephila clavipes]